MTASNLEIATCTMCQTHIEYEPTSFMGVLMPAPNVCDPCSAKVEESHHAERLEEFRAERLKRFVEICPNKMAAIDTKKMVCQKPEDKLARCMSHDLERGLVIHGDTGLGKTRLMWQLARRVFVDELQGMRVLRDSQFGRMIERAYAEGQGEHDKMIESLCRVPFLIIDDLGKAKITHRVETDLFDIIDRRYENGLPCIFTSQFVGQGLEQRFPTFETGQAIVRRIRETCDNLTLIEG